MKSFLLLFVSFFLFPISVGAGDNPVRFSVASSSYEGEAEITIHLDIEKGWKVYSDQPGGTGLPFKINFSQVKNLAKPMVIWPKAQIYSEGGLSANVYIDKVDIPIVLRPRESNDPITGYLVLEYGACKESCIRFEEKVDIKLIPVSGEKEVGMSVYFAVVLGLLGGLILNIMPCVLPVISLKLIGLVKFSGKNKTAIRRHLLAIILGILTSFFVLALLTESVRHAGGMIGWGFQFQHPGFVIFLIFVLALFGINLWGDFEIAVPSFLNRLNILRESKLYIGDFFSGLFATLLATPCTAPFLSVAVAFALDQRFLTMLVLYQSIAFGFAFPFILLFIYPKLVGFMPKPGVWMLKLKKMFAVVLILTAVWFLYVLSFQLSFYTLVMVVVSVIFMRVVIRDQKYLKSNFTKLVLVLGLFIATYHCSFYLNEKVIKLGDEIKSLWHPFAEDNISDYVEQGKVVLIDVTAEWCLTCKYNKYTVLNNPYMLKYFAQNGIVLMRADYTKPSKEISKYIERFGRRGIPVNVIYSRKFKDGILMPEILTVGVLKHFLHESS